MNRLLFCVCLVAVIVTNTDAQQGLGVRPVPDWVVPVSFSDQVSDTSNTGGGHYFLLLNQQFNPETQEVYTEYAIKVLSEMGLSYASSVNESFDPSFQKMDFHEVQVIRNGKPINKLVRSDFSLLRREENLSRQMYDGTLSAVLDIKGVNAGDVIKYSFTTRGTNPVFKNHFFRTLYLKYGAPTGKIYYRICASPNRALTLKNNEHDLKPVEDSFKQYKTYTWSLENVGALLSDDSSPGWYDPFPRVEITDFSSWEHLSAWANELFKIDLRKSSALNSFIDSLKQIENNEQRVLGAIRSIQDKVRYLSLSNGISGFQPHPPAEVFENKYGDCKDKSVLLSEVLNAIGVKSQAVLVNTNNGKAMQTKLPSPWLFDHCIVKLEYEDSTYWIDPTINFQRGGLKKTFFPTYYYGLVVGSRESALTSIPVARAARSVLIKEDYFIDELDADARLEVTTEYVGSDADGTRDYWLANSQTEIDKGYMNFYANEYPDITLSAPATFEDDTVNNIFTTHEQYKIASFWSYDSASSQKIAKTYARFLSTYLHKPSTKIRQAPYALGFDREVKQVIKVHMPEEWNVDDHQKTITAHGLLFKSRWFYADKVIRLDYSLNFTDDHVPADKVAAYVKGIDEIYDQLTFQVMYTPAGAVAQASFNWPLLGITVVFGLVLFFAMKRLYDYDPPAAESIEQHNNIGGWLVLPAIGLSLSPLLLIYQVYTTGFFDYNQWRLIVDPNFSGYNPSLGVFVIVELLINVALIGYSFVVMILFWRRRTSTPLLMAIFYGLSFIVLLGDSLAGSMFAVETEDSEINSIIRSLIAAAIWIPYFLRSERVKGTFTERLV